MVIDEQRAYGRAAAMWLVATWITGWLVGRHFGTTVGDIAAWVPFAMCLRCTWKWWQAKSRSS